MSDDELVEKLKMGNEEAFELLYARHASGLLRHLYHLMGNKQEAEELLNECMLLLIQKLNFYTPNPALNNSFKSWFYRLSTNRAIDEIRKRKSRMAPDQMEDPDYMPSADDLYNDKEQDKLLESLIMKLPVVQRMLLSMRVLEDLSYTEISAILGKDINSVKQGLFQARKSMKQLLAARGEL